MSEPSDPRIQELISRILQANEEVISEAFLRAETRIEDSEDE